MNKKISVILPLVFLLIPMSIFAEIIVQKPSKTEERKIFEKTDNTKQLSYEQITITTYYPAPYGVYTELKTEKLTLGETTFTIAQDSSACPEGYEIFAVRWMPVTCSSQIPGPRNMCVTGKFAWGSDLDYAGRVGSACRYCVESRMVPDEHYNFCIKNGGEESDCRYVCTKWDECITTKKEYTVCVKLPENESKEKESEKAR